MDAFHLVELGTDDISVVIDIKGIVRTESLARCPDLGRLNSHSQSLVGVLETLPAFEVFAAGPSIFMIIAPRTCREPHQLKVGDLHSGALGHLDEELGL